MTADVFIRRATPQDADDIACMLGELLADIAGADVAGDVGFDCQATAAARRIFLSHEDYVAFIARDHAGRAHGFLTAYENRMPDMAMADGTIVELFVRTDAPGGERARLLIDALRVFARSRRWNRLEVTLPPYALHLLDTSFLLALGFEVASGHKLHCLLHRTDWPLAVR